MQAGATFVGMNRCRGRPADLHLVFWRMLTEGWRSLHCASYAELLPVPRVVIGLFVFRG